MPVNVYAGSLIRILEAVTPFADHTNWHPTLAGVRFESTKDNLAVIATDRYALAVADERAETSGRHLKFTLGLAELKELMPVLRRRRASEILIAQNVGGVSFIMPGMKMEIPPFSGSEHRFVKWRELLAKYTDKGTEPVSAAQVNPRYLGMAGIKSGQLARIHHLGATEPTMVSVDDWFLALIMPRKPEGVEPGEMVGFSTSMVRNHMARYCQELPMELEKQ